MESNSDIFINSESLRIRIPKLNMTDSELEVSDSPTLSEGISYISEESLDFEFESPTGRNNPQIKYVQRETMTFIPVQFIEEDLTPTPPPPKREDLTPTPPPPKHEDLTPIPPPPLEDDLISSVEYSEENIVPVLNIYSPTLSISPTLHSPNESRIDIPNVEQTRQKINLLREIGSSILLISVLIFVSPILIIIAIMYCITALCQN
jgi:hypothetical protein